MPRRRLSIRRASLVPDELLDAAPSQTVASKGGVSAEIANENSNANANAEASDPKAKAAAAAAKQLTPTDAATGFGFFNDDEEEKRNSRKKAARRRSMRRRSLRPSPRKSKSRDSAAGAAPAVIKEKKDPAQLKTLYSAIIKMCAQNKITEKNCWNDFIDNIDEILDM